MFQDPLFLPRRAGQGQSGNQENPRIFDNPLIRGLMQELWNIAVLCMCFAASHCLKSLKSMKHCFFVVFVDVSFDATISYFCLWPISGTISEI